MTTFSNLQSNGVPLGVPFGAGNVYYVIKSDETFYDRFVRKHQGTYEDGSEIVHADDGSGDGIQTALDACVANRNDYVIVNPSESDYDLTAALTMSKKAVHLICPAGWGYDRGATNACRIEQTTDDEPLIEVSASAVEISGFYFKNNYITTAGGGIILSNTTYGLNIHHNYFAMRLKTTTNEPMIGPLIANTTGDAGAWSTIYRNVFQSQSGASATIPAIVRFNSQATGVRVIACDFAIGDTDNTATVGCLVGSVKGYVGDCNFMAHQTASGAGVFTHCISIHSSGSAIGNRAAVKSNMLVGGTDECSFSDNRNGVAGGATIVDYEA